MIFIILLKETWKKRSYPTGREYPRLVQLCFLFNEKIIEHLFIGRGFTYLPKNSMEKDTDADTRGRVDSIQGRDKQAEVNGQISAWPRANTSISTETYPK